MNAADTSKPPEREGQAFRPAVWPIFLAVCLTGVPVALALLFWRLGRQAWPAILIGGVGGALAALVYSFILTLAFPVKLTLEGVHGHSVWGTRRFIRWRDINGVRPFRLLNLKYLRLYSRSQLGPTWIALFLARPDEFREQLRALAPPDDPLSQFLHIGDEDRPRQPIPPP